MDFCPRELGLEFGVFRGSCSLTPYCIWLVVSTCEIPETCVASRLIVLILLPQSLVFTSGFYWQRFKHDQCCYQQASVKKRLLTQEVRMKSAKDSSRGSKPPPLPPSNRAESLQLQAQPTAEPAPLLDTSMPAPCNLQVFASS